MKGWFSDKKEAVAALKRVPLLEVGKGGKQGWVYGVTKEWGGVKRCVT